MLVVKGYVRGVYKPPKPRWCWYLQRLSGDFPEQSLRGSQRRTARAESYPRTVGQGRWDREVHSLCEAECGSQ